MAASVSITYVDATGPVIRIGFNIFLSGTYPTGGDLLNFMTAVQDPLYQGMYAGVEALGAPVDIDCWDVGGDLTHFEMAILGTTIVNSKIKISTSSNQTELANLTAYAGNAILTVAKLIGEAVFNKL